MPSQFLLFLLCALACAPACLRAGQAEGGLIAGNGADSLYLCQRDGGDGFVAFTTSSAAADSNYVYVITTATDEPVVIALLDSAAFDFGPVTLEEVRVYAISYTGELAVVVGFPITLLPLSDGCFELSGNYVSIFTGCGVSAQDPRGTLAGVALTAFPNPAAGPSLTLKLEANRGLPPGRVTVLDASGRPALPPVDVSAGASIKKITLEVSRLPAGIYVVIYATSAGRAFTRFIKP